MKKLLTLALALIILAAFPGLSGAQTAEEKKPTAGEKRIDKPSPKLMTGKVIQVNEQEKTFTIVAKGKEYKFTFQKIEFPYKVGEVIDVTYTENPGGPMEATNLNSSRSNILLRVRKPETTAARAWPVAFRLVRRQGTLLTVPS